LRLVRIPVLSKSVSFAELSKSKKDLLNAGPMAAKDVKKEASDAGISPKSLRSAREALRIKPEKAGMEGGWVWTLPKMPSVAEGARENQRAPSRD
jgi:hypothetical protein